jgi:hypothetical protein
MFDKRRGFGSCRFRLEDGGKKRIEEITESDCIMVENMLRSKKRLEKLDRQTDRHDYGWFTGDLYL